MNIHVKRGLATGGIALGIGRAATNMHYLGKPGFVGPALAAGSATYLAHTFHSTHGNVAKASGVKPHNQTTRTRVRR